MKNTIFAKMSGAVVASALFLTLVAAQADPGYAQIKKVVGTVTYAGATGSGNATAGLALPAGSQITTGANSYIDLDLGPNGNALRIEANSRVTLDTLKFRRVGKQTTSDTMLNVQRGNVVANVVKKLSRASRYRIQTPKGIAGIRGTTFRAGSAGVTVVTGTVSFQPQAGGGVQLVLGGQMFQGNTVQPARQVQTIANIAIQTTANTQTADVVAQTVSQFATAMAARAAQDSAAAGQSGADSAAQIAQQVVQALVTALESAAADAPAGIRAQVTQALQSVRGALAQITAGAAAKAAAIGVAAAGGTAAEAKAAASSAARQTGSNAGDAQALADGLGGTIDRIKAGGSAEAEVETTGDLAPAGQTAPATPATTVTQPISPIAP